MSILNNNHTTSEHLRQRLFNWVDGCIMAAVDWLITIAFFFVLIAGPIIAAIFLFKSL